MISLNHKEVVFGNFPNKEFNMDIELLDIRPSNYIEWNFEDNGDFIKLYTLKSYLDGLDKRSRLYIGYMPYSRMDRMNDSYAFSLKYACKMINDMGFYKVVVKEPHSDVTPALLDRCSVFDWCMGKIMTKEPDELGIARAICMDEVDSLFFPDAGAQKRYQTEMPYAVGYKQRDFATGDITSFEIQGGIGENVLIVDDLCSRGGTFIHSAIELKRAGAKKVSLLVAHCEENVFTGELFDHIDTLYTSGGMLDKMIANNECPIVQEQIKQIVIL
jgi:ribose-phosphate pyrophosphokinase